MFLFHLIKFEAELSLVSAQNSLYRIAVFYTMTNHKIKSKSSTRCVGRVLMSFQEPKESHRRKSNPHPAKMLKTAEILESSFIFAVSIHTG